MRIIEQESFIQSPVFLADNIRDLETSKSYILKNSDPNLEIDIDKSDSQNLTKNFPWYYYTACVVINNINHDPALDHKLTKNPVRLEDYSGALFVKLPDRLTQVIRKLIHGKDQVPYQELIDTLWNHRRVCLGLSLEHDPEAIFGEHISNYTLLDVSGFTQRKKKEKKEELLKELAPQALPTF